MTQETIVSNRVGAEQVTTIVEDVRDGHDTAKAELCRLVYGELREIAHQLMPQASGQTLQPTALVNEVMLRLLDRHTLECFPNRRCFFAVAVSAMKQILIDHHRLRKTLRQGGDRQRESLDLLLDVVQREAKADFEQLHLALEQLSEEDPRQHEVVQLRFFGGLTLKETADMLNVSVSTVRRNWRLARAKLYAALQES